MLALCAGCTSAKASDSVACGPTTNVAVTKLVDQMAGVNRKATSGCMTGLTDKDQAEIQKINVELTAISKENTQANQKQYKEKVSQILRAHEPNLSPAAVVAVIADFHQRRLMSFISALKGHPDFAKAFLKFNFEANRFTERRDRLLGGVRDYDEDSKRLDAASADLFKTMGATQVDPTLQRNLKKNVNLVLMDTYRHAGDRSAQATRQFAVAQAAVGAVLAADLIVASFVTGGLTSQLAAGATAASGSAIVGVLTGTAVATVAGAAGGAGFMAGLGIAKMAGHAAVSGAPDSSFFCNLANEVNQHGGEVVHEALVGAAIGGAIGMGLGLLAPMAAVASVAGQGVAIGFTAWGAGGTLVEGTKAYELCKQADAASAAGKTDEAFRLREECKRLAVDATVDGAATVAGGVGVYHGVRGVNGESGPSPTLQETAGKAVLELKTAGKTYDAGLSNMKAAAALKEAEGARALDPAYISKRLEEIGKRLKEMGDEPPPDLTTPEGRELNAKKMEEASLLLTSRDLFKGAQIYVATQAITPATQDKKKAAAPLPPRVTELRPPQPELAASSQKIPELSRVNFGEEKKARTK